MNLLKGAGFESNADGSELKMENVDLVMLKEAMRLVENNL